MTTKPLNVKLTERQLRWVVSQLETSFETNHLSADEAEVMRILNAQLKVKRK